MTTTIVFDMSFQSTAADVREINFHTDVACGLRIIINGKFLSYRKNVERCQGRIQFIHFILFLPLHGSCVGGNDAIPK